jgi:iron complex outermembrane receptor protein
MNRKHPLPFFFLWLTLVFASGHSAFAADGSTAAAAQRLGVVTGLVRNVATTAFLEEARVQVVGTNNVVLTDRQGRFEIAVPPGPVSLSISYLGLNPETLSLVVSAGETVVRNVGLTSEVYLLDALTVVGDREGNALAITKQKEAVNAKNVVSTDSLGNLAGGNVGDFLQSLPGITANYVAMEVRTVSIRGIDADLNSVTMDGERVASSASANTGRAFEFEQASLGLIETIEVTKAPTPDMDADSIGGSVNMVSKSAFDRADARSFTYMAGFVNRAGYRAPADSWTKEPINGIGPSLNFTYSDVIGPKRNIGILVTGTWHVDPSADLRTTVRDQLALNVPHYVYSVVGPEVLGNPRTRLSTGIKLDYKLSDRTVITLNTVYNWFQEASFIQQRSLTTSQALATFNAQGVRTGTGTIMPGYTDTFTEVLTSTNSLSTLTSTTNDKSGRTIVLQPSVRHRFKDGLQVDYGMSYSNSNTYYDTSPFNRHYDAIPKGTVTAQLRNTGWTVDRSKDRAVPAITQTTGPSLYDINNFSNLVLTQPHRNGVDSILNARLNVKKSVELAVPAFVKAGFNYRRHQRELDYQSHRYNPKTQPNLAQFAERSDGYEAVMNAYLKKSREPKVPLLDSYAVAKNAQEHPELWTEDMAYYYSEMLTNDRSVAEKIAGAYVMGNVQIGGLSILAGLRLEDTRTDGEGPLVQITPAEAARRAAWVGALTDDEIRRRAYAQYGGRSKGTGQYRNIFPGIHFKYATPGGLMARLSHSTGIGRPEFGQIMPNSSANYTAETLTINNPALKPQYSNNFDASVEYYFEPIGLFSAGVFLKELSDFIYQDRSQSIGAGANNGYEGEYQGFTIITSSNGGSARYRGLELSYQQQFRFLPGLWRGLGVNMNYTKVETKGDYGGRVATTQVAGMVPETANVALTFVQKGWNLRWQWNWRSSRLVTISTNPAAMVYDMPKTATTVKLKYAMSPKLGFFCNVENLFSEPLFQTYFVTEDRLFQVRPTAAKITAGVQGRF